MKPINLEESTSQKTFSEDKKETGYINPLKKKLKLRSFRPNKSIIKMKSFRPTTAAKLITSDDEE